ncbi:MULTISPECIES: protein-tyrosine phosphatase family protein [unclassified Yoonia]|uniref:protein-tyrosine phosphatase family protein n=1 Tax=unclassified Yoonia TaxID=2629118 RepID=UPI002B00150D|nr:MULTISPECIES: sulfur transferase domain-containing protein [unclassified Yoonia]
MPQYQIFALPVAGGVLALSPLPQGDAVQDLLDWRPDLVVSMTGQEEMDRLGAGDLGAVLRAAGVAWHHLPVVDYGTPASPDVTVIEGAALATLRAGGKVLTHCRGGCGRSGMMALRLMIAAGEDPDVALTRLRALRPCAVETDAQFAWAKG